MKRHLLNFVAGFLATLVFHQGAIFLLHRAGIMPNPGYSMTPTAPFGVPSVLSLSFFGGLWGVLLARIIRSQPRTQYWVKWILFGALAPTAVAYLVVLPLKGIELRPAMIPFGFFLNGLWGLGTAVFIKLFRTGMS